MDCSALLAMVPAPAAPVDAAGDWAGVEGSLCRLPDDYRQLVQRYGTGCFDHFLWIFTPFTDNESLNLLAQVGVIREVHRSLADEYGEPQSYPYFPEPAGLLPFGVTDNGDYLYWSTRGVPNDWPVVVGASRDPRYEALDGGACRVLSDLLSQRLRCDIFPRDFPSAHPQFTALNKFSQ